ncbi:nitroreductase family protein [Erythrobacter vulgaris]|uniref:Nitroreductase family protein n=1 Tax=Qipengyuania vulgaris TaxID=291985 RepID=A0A844XU57_9SPHN|nr:nitroreductase family protein [Qipengyuania vulgaris]MXO49421.1 nitroreductase family protein [Qipengyuania vulgaris]
MLVQLKRIAKSLLAIGWIRALFDTVQRAILEVAGANRLLAHAYHALNPFAFNREQAAVARGARNYYRNTGTERQSHVELRRNVHRIEKGLTMIPRRDVFAADFIAETIGYYEVAVRQAFAAPGSLDELELQWAHDVLEAYFEACTAAHPVIAKARTGFQNLPWDRGNQGLAPTPKSVRGNSLLAVEQFEELARQRRSVRFFDQRPVPRELIDRALAIGAQAPTACNRMPYEFRVFDDGEMVRKVAALPFGAAGYNHQIPALAVVIGKLESYFSPRDRHAIYVDSSLAAMSFMFALETQGLSSSVINWPDFEPLEAKMQKLLGLDLSQRVVMLIALGYADPATLVPYSQKKGLDTFRSFNRLAG